MIDLKAMRERATEGLAIAEKATEGPLVAWKDHPRERGFSVCTVDALGLGDIDVAESLNEHDSAFFADARTRAPDAYRDVIALCEALEHAQNRINQLEGYREPDALIERASKILDYHEDGGEMAGGDVDELANVADDLLQALGVARVDLARVNAENEALRDERVSLLQEVSRLSKYDPAKRYTFID